jgi:hypothetical protein
MNADKNKLFSYRRHLRSSAAQTSAATPLSFDRSAAGKIGEGGST